MVTITATWQSILISAGIVCGATMFLSYTFIRAYERVIGIPIHKRVKAAIPVILAVALFYVFGGVKEPWVRALIGFGVGTVSTTFYQWFADKLLALMDGLFNTLLDALKERLSSIIGKKP